MSTDFKDKLSLDATAPRHAEYIDPEIIKGSTDVIHIDHAAEKKLIRKLDGWIIPPVMLLYLFSFLDRTNIGNARLYGLRRIWV